MQKISLCLTTWERVELTINSFLNVYEDERIGEIVISDDCSSDLVYEQLKWWAAYYPKVKLIRTPQNLDCYLNKKFCLEHAENEYAIIFDSDNTLTVEYLDAIYCQHWYKDTILAPVWAKPTFDYRLFEGLTLTAYHAAEFLKRKMSDTALNTSNYFVPVQPFLEIMDTSVNPNTSEAIFTNYNWLKAGNKIHFTPNMVYEHLVHSGSHYQKNSHKNPGFYENILSKIKELPDLCII